MQFPHFPLCAAWPKRKLIQAQGKNADVLRRDTQNWEGGKLAAVGKLGRRALCHASALDSPGAEEEPTELADTGSQEVSGDLDTDEGWF